ncbi:hypothetical protein JQ615_31860 [Bradyrhizobium jicamae]|uniref:Uncharacterized protein n=1 Tax=Bradyrhizobium jicamae TaxID=280332 RepID=A0ABS5FT16_9BRAD|nr:hypothetical protein [Bradyrhizobium jicamae]MBR0799972.1 hypothetical protein [Bradyrhizobium jicamae]
MCIESTVATEHSLPTCAFPVVLKVGYAALLACGLLLCSVGGAASRGGFGNDDPWSPHHIDDLPIEVRKYIATICKGPAAAQHDFATYLPQDRRWRINLEYLRCDGLDGSFRRGDQCLDVDFVEVGSHYRLARRQYRSCGF